MTRVAVIDDYQDAARSCANWSLLGDEVRVEMFHDHLASQDEVATRLAEFDVVVIMRERTPFPASLLEALPNLRFLVTTGPFNAVVDVGAAERLGIVVSGTGGTRHPTSELTWALILALARKIPAEDAAIRAGRWQVALGSDLRDKTLGLLGLGYIGSAVAAVGQAFGMRTIAWSQNLTADEARGKGVERVEKDELFQSADVLSVHLVLSERTTGIVGCRELELMKPTAYFINTSRAPLVSEPALIEILEKGRIAGAGLDVFDIEPLPLGHPFRRLPNVVVTPHIGYVTRELYELFFGEVVDDIRNFLAGTPVRVVAP